MDPRKIPGNLRAADTCGDRKADAGRRAACTMVHALVHARMARKARFRADDTQAFRTPRATARPSSHPWESLTICRGTQTQVPSRFLLGDGLRPCSPQCVEGYGHVHPLAVDSVEGVAPGFAVPPRRVIAARHRGPGDTRHGRASRSIHPTTAGGRASRPFHGIHHPEIKNSETEKKNKDAPRGHSGFRRRGDGCRDLWPGCDPSIASLPR